MGLNELVSAERVHIGFFGRRNAGKSSLVNAITGQQLAVVSPVKGTTTDPVRKAMELLPLGPVVIIDTPGLDDEGELGSLRVEKTRQVLRKTDIAVVVIDAVLGWSDQEEALYAELSQRNIPTLVVYNKADLLETLPKLEKFQLLASAKTGQGIEAIKEALAAFAKAQKRLRLLCSDLFDSGDLVILVTPIDGSAPKGRLILPQQLVIRDILDHHGCPLCCQPEELPGLLARLQTPPRLVITDSQVFGKVSKILPVEIPLTSFSILMARYKGDLHQLLEGAETLGQLKDGDKVLICEGCTHHRQCNDIGTVKLPGWVRSFAQGEPEFRFCSGGDFPGDLSSYRLVIHCGGCMLNEAEMRHRMAKCAEAGVPMVNYGLAIAQIHGILQRSIQPLM